MSRPPDAALAAALEGAILLEASRLATARRVAAVERARRPADAPPFLAVALLGEIEPGRRGYYPAEWVWMKALDELGFAVERWSWEQGGVGRDA